MQKIKSTQAFTMIELLTVMLLVSILSAIAIPSFLDFKRDGKIASLRQNLNAIRVGVKNQMQQILLRCQVSTIGGTYTTRTGHSAHQAMMTILLFANDITYVPFGNIAYRLCISSEVPEPQERKFFDISSSQVAKRYQSGVEVSSTSFLPENPLSINNSDLNIFYGMSVAAIDFYGGKCNVVDFYKALGLHYHWFYVYDFQPGVGWSYQDFIPGSNTPGINECNF